MAENAKSVYDNLRKDSVYCAAPFGHIRGQRVVQGLYTRVEVRLMYSSKFEPISALVVTAIRI